MAAAVGLDAELVGQGGQEAGLVLGLGGDQPGAAAGLQVQHRPQFGQDVECVQAQVVLIPAGARIARLPCRASAIPRQANTRAAASGIAASSPATTANRLVASTIRYWAVKLTTAAAAASRHNPVAAFRSQMPEWSRPDAFHRGRSPAGFPVSGAAAMNGRARLGSTRRMHGIKARPAGSSPIRRRR